MQTNRLSHARRFILGLGAALALAFTGCQSPVIMNFTRPAVPANPSQIYTISARIAPRAVGLVQGSVIPRIIIDGKSYAMTPSPVGQDLYDFEYQVPAGREELRYYFIVEYQVSRDGITRRREDYSALQTLKIIGRHALSLSASRGPVGARIGIYGRGFTVADTVTFDGDPVPTQIDSPTSVSFYVPGVPVNQNYTVAIGDSVVGTFRVDAGGAPAPAYRNPARQPAAATPGGAPAAGAASAGFAVAPSTINIAEKEIITLTFTSPVVLTARTLVDVTTDIPDSVIMPEVFIPGGGNSTSVTVEGGKPGAGYLYVRGPGSSKEIRIPVTVRGR
ncbi:MAG: cell surface protein [Opitutaceae bacterium]|nr:cell surface protein [Opitutaceae bacterium]